MSHKARARIAFGAAGVFLLVLLAVLLSMAHFHEKATDLQPSPSMTVEEQEAAKEVGDGFPIVDWAYWKQVNPDVIGWITVPGTSIDYPIVQAGEDNPTFYLKHDIYGDYNVYGCPYLDAGCAQGGLFGSPNAVVFGHHMSDGSMFSPLASCTDAAFAAEHRRILVQTPQEKRVYTIQAAEIIPGWEEIKQVEFDGSADFAAYYAERFAACSMKLAEDADGVRQVLTLCTCSYNYWSDNERTLVYAAPLEDRMEEQEK